MNRTTTNLEDAFILISKAQGLLKDYRGLAAACQIILEEIDAAVDYESERIAHED